MSGAAMAVQRALVAALRGAPFSVAPTGIYDGPPVDAAFPYVAVSDGATSDWSHKSGRGREHRLSVAVWDDGVSPTRLHRLIGEVEAAVEGMPRALDGHSVASLVFLRARVVRDADGPWVGRVDYRVRTLEG
jgi:hypothetical protein